MKNKKRILRWVKIIIILYSLGGIALYYLQEKILFRPTKLDADYPWQFSQPFTEANIAFDDKTNFNIVQFTVPDSLRKGIVLYFHGNRENILHYAPFAQNFIRNHYEVWMPDYPGYGKSSGELSEIILYEEALQVYKLARKKYAPSQIIIYGKSLGSGIAAELAAVRDCKRLILETPYYSIPALISRFCGIYPLGLLIHYQLPVYEYLPKLTAPISLIHGNRDWTIPFSHAERLKKLLKPGDELIRIEGGSHNDLNTFPLFHQKLDSLLRN